MLSAEEKLYVSIHSFYALPFTQFDMEMDCHSTIEIMYVTKGSCKVITEDREHLLTERKFIYLNADTMHRLVVTDEHCSILCLEFRFQKERTNLHIHELLEKSKEAQLLYYMKDAYWIGDDTKNVGYALKDLISCISDSLHNVNNCPNLDSYTQTEQNYLLQLLFLRMMLEIASCYTQKESAAGLKYLKKACVYIAEHLTEELRIPALAEFAGVNKSYLHLLFSQHLHCTITEYINQKRMEHAEFLLLNSTMTITEIAFHTGYNNRQHFGNMFTRYYQMSPKVYRQLHKKNKNVFPATSWRD